MYQKITKIQKKVTYTTLLPPTGDCHAQVDVASFNWCDGLPLMPKTMPHAALAAPGPRHRLKPPAWRGRKAVSMHARVGEGG